MIHLCIVLSILGLLVPAQPPLAIYASQSSAETTTGGTFSVSLAVYSTSAEPLTLELDAPTPVGMTLLSTTWTTDTISQDRPVSITLNYSVQMPNDGHLEVMAYTVKDGAGNLAARWLLIRVGPVVWPDAKTEHRLYMPMLAG